MCHLLVLKEDKDKLYCKVVSKTPVVMEVLSITHLNECAAVSTAKAANNETRNFFVYNNFPIYSLHSLPDVGIL